MVCKKSLYCLKNGPCANDQIRKQIWEDNIRFRESLRNINQSDHYWSFQISNNDYSDFDDAPFHRKRNKSLWKSRNCYDCASVTHDFAPNDSCCCIGKTEQPRRYSKQNDVNVNQNDSPETKALLLRPSKQIQTQPVTYIPRLNSCKTRNLSEYCHRYRNSLSSAQLQPSTKVKFSSQSTLFQPKKNVNIRRFPSMDVLSKLKDTSVKDVEQECKVNAAIKQLNNVKLGKGKDVKLPPWLSGTPLSRTTRKMLQKDKQIPFMTYGCNNLNDVVGSKRTHNVFASTTEVYPNALSAKQQRDEMIAKCLKNEMIFRNSLLNNGASKKMVNHSSLWSVEGSKEQKGRDACSLSRKKSQKNVI